MNTQANAVSDSHVRAQVVSPSAESQTRPFYWSVRRELWENRSIYLAPLAVAGAFFIGFVFTHLRLAAQIRALSNLNPAAQREAIAQPYDIIAGLMMVTGMFVGAFYCLDALYGERRERTILFWKSMPVSDVTTVLSKASVPLVILPLVTFAVGAATQFLMLVWTSVLLLASGMSPGRLWQEVSFVRMALLLLYHLLTVHAISPAPIYCWFLLVSAWARRWPILWATLPAVVIGGFEKLIFHTSHFTDMLLDRLSGGGTDAMNVHHQIFPTNPILHITPGRFVGSWHLWVGLIVGALFLAVTVRVRRDRGPL
jgi:ABC-2 type transport system permease protein